MALWITAEDADTYFETRLHSSAWASASEDEKTAALTTAQNDLLACPDFEFDLDTDPTEAQQHAVCEQALFLLANPDMEARIALQAQGVTRAGIIDETYSGGVTAGLIALRARALLGAGGFSATGTSTFRVER